MAHPEPPDTVAGNIVRLPHASRSRIVKDAVESNLDVMHHRLPPVLRPVRRGARLALSYATRFALPVATFAALLNGASWRVDAGAERAQRSENEAIVAHAIQSEPAGFGSLPTWKRVADSNAAARGSTISPVVLGLSVRRVIIDAGHGGDHPGASSASGLAEKTVTLDIAQRFRELVVARGFEAVMTRESDTTVSLRERATAANAQRGDVFVSIHINALGPASAFGIETYYMGPDAGLESDGVAARENQHSGYSLADLRMLLDNIYADARRDESRRLARAVQLSLVRAIQHTDPAVVNRGVKMAPFVVLAATEMPAILAEVSCLTDTREAQRLEDPSHRQRIAEALASGLTSFAMASSSPPKGHNARGN